MATATRTSAPANRRQHVADSEEGPARASAVRPAHRASAPSAIRSSSCNPRPMMKNPVMFVVEVGAAMTTVLAVRDLAIRSADCRVHLPDHALAVVYRAVRQLRRSHGGRARQGAGRHAAQDQDRNHRAAHAERPARRLSPPRSCAAATSCCVEIGETIPGDGDVIEGIASVDESAITGESAPVIRESGGDRSAVTGGTKVLSDWIKVKITSNPGETFLDRMIALVEGAERQKTPNEIALNIVIAGLTLVFLLAVVTLQPFAVYSVQPAARRPSVTVLISLLVCLIPTTIGGLLSAIGIAGMDRVMQHNVLAMSGKAVEAAGDVNTLLLDKTGTITLGNRQAVEFIPVDGVTPEENWPMRRSSRAWPTKRRKAAPSWCWPSRSTTSAGARWRSTRPHFIPFTAQTRMSGVDIDGRLHPQGRHRIGVRIRAGARRRRPRRTAGYHRPHLALRRNAAGGGRSRTARSGVVHLKDVVKGGMRERFEQLRAMGIRTVMITGDNPLTAAAIAAEAGVDDFLAQATPKDKMDLIKKEQAGGRLVAMTGDGTNDAPALAQADVGLAMNTGTMAAKEAGNMVDLDSNPTKLIEVVAIGKQLLMTRGALTTFLHRQRHRQVFRDPAGDVHGDLSGAGAAQHHGPAQRRRAPCWRR